MYSKMDRANQLRRRRGIRDTFRVAKRYAIIGTAVLGLAYLSDKCDAGEKMDYSMKKGIEYVMK